MEWATLSQWASVLAAIIFFIIRDQRERRRQSESQSEWRGALDERLDNIDEKLDKQTELCWNERQQLWKRTDENSKEINYMRGRANGK